MNLKQVIKKWEELGYEIRYFSKSIHLVKEDRLGFKKTIVIAMDTKWYRPIYESNMYDEDQMYQFSEITFQEHQLLHKLFELWGWFDE